MPELDARGVSVRFGETVALEDLDVRVDSGRILTLVGPSGSGKSTFLRAVAGFERPSAGTIRVGDRTLVGGGVHLPPEERGLGMVFQHHAVWPHLSVADNVAYPLRRAKVPAARRRALVAEALETVELGELARRRPDTLSGGQRQRVSLARAVVARPSVLLLDEALSALDEPLRASLRLVLRRLAAEHGLTMVHVTHDRGEALALGDEVAVLHRGRLVQCDVPDRLDAAPNSAFVAGFLHDATLVDGTVDGDGFRSDDGGITLGADVLTGPAGTVRGPATLALLPGGLDLVTPDVAEGRIGAEFITSLYGRSGRTVICRHGDTELRILTPAGTAAPGRVGEAVGVDVRRGFVYPRD
ncbi:ABC transporter ATP-binding protein [Dietzia cinnamea]|uniref:ABC transporter ATP-binding protein n=1 Tax=Dietzia cinnamea TaxID=321318 RepID=UPI0021A5C150|nr:ABC transporter ATP-binding protein [Dietzia cinnamea]MCT1710641.1 ABC transporter ATP-binding protein [Dietzia cinnamea]MCT2273022.1 ABC transporter ATP-binding protein [Dietzia cinnamea]